MAAYIGSHKIDKCYLGTQEIDKVMLGAHEVCSSAVALLPLPADSAAFIKDPSDYIRDGVSYNAVKVNPEKIYPDGPDACIAAYNVYDWVGAKAGGVNVNIPHAGADNKGQIETAHSNGMKSVVMFRDYRGVPLGGGIGGTTYQLVEIYESAAGALVTKHAFAESVRSRMRQFLDHPVAGLNESIIGWEPYGDDMLECAWTCYADKNNFGTRDCRNTSDGTFCHTQAQFWAAFNWYWEIIRDYDTPGSTAFDGVRGHVNGLRRGLHLLPFTDAYLSYSSFDTRNWAQDASYMTSQCYWGYDGVATQIKTFWSLWYVWDNADRMVRLAAQRPKPSNGKARNIIPTLYSDQRSRLPSSVNTIPLTKKENMAELLLKMIAGSTGFFVYQWQHGEHYFSVSDNYLSSLIKFFTEKSIPEAMLWGKDVTSEFTRTKLNANEWAAQALRNPDLGGSDPTWTGWRVDQIVWKAVQYKSKVYLCVVNCMPEQAEYDYLKTLSNYGPPAPGADGRASTSGINTRFSFAGGMVGLKCADLVGNAKSSHIDLGAGTITVDLPSYGSAIYVFEPDDGYAGGNVPPPAPGITLHPVGGTFHVGDPVPTMHVGYTPSTASVQWQWQHFGSGVAWADIPGATSDNYTMHDSGLGVNSSQDGDEFRAKVTTSGKPPVYSNTAHILVT